MSLEDMNGLKMNVAEPYHRIYIFSRSWIMYSEKKFNVISQQNGKYVFDMRSKMERVNCEDKKNKIQ